MAFPAAQKISYFRFLYGPLLAYKENDSVAIEWEVNLEHFSSYKAGCKDTTSRQTDYTSFLYTVDKETFKQLNNLSWDFYKDKVTPRYKSLTEWYMIYIKYQDGTEKKYLFPSVFIITNNNLSEYETLLNNLYLLLRSCFPDII